MTHAFRSLSSTLKLFAGGFHGDALPSRILLFVIGSLLLLMPLSEHLWDWDRFFHGGQDMEFGLVTVAAALGLSLLLAHQHPLANPLPVTVRDYARTQDIRLDRVYRVQTVDDRRPGCRSMPLQI